MIKKTLFLLCIIASILISGCATTTQTVSPASKTSQYGMGQRRLLTPEGKKTEELSTAEEYERLGDLNLRRGDVNNAFISYTRALQMEPERLSVSYKTGRLFLLKGMTEEARKEFEKIIKKDPENALGYEGMGRTHLLDGDVETAIDHLTNSLALDKHLWEVHNLLGVGYDRQRKFTLAIYHYQTAISIKPDVGAIYNNLGVSYFMNSEYDKARDAFVSAIEKKEEGSKVYNNLALTLGKLGEYREAHEVLKRAGSAATAQNNLGYLYMLEGKNNEAATAFEKALELSPKFYVQANDNLKSTKEALQN